MTYHILQSNNVNNGVINLKKAFNGKYHFHSFIFANNLYNMTTNNNILPYQEGITLTLIELDNQYINYADMATHLQSKISAVSGGTPSVNYDENTGKFTLTNTVSFSLKFGDTSQNTCHQLLGFDKSNTSTGMTITSDKVADLTAFKCIHINIKQDECHSVFDENYGNYTFVIQGKAEFGDILTYNSKEKDYMPQQLLLESTKRLEISFYDENNNPLDIDNWTLILSK